MGRTQLLAVGMMFCVTGAVQAQIVVSVPDRTPESAPYVPPPPPPPRPEEPERPQARPEPLPSVVEFDESGDLKPLEPSKFEASLRAFTFDDATWEKLKPVLSEYHASVDRTVIEQMEMMMGVREKLATIDEVTDFGAVLELTQYIRGLPNNDLIDRAKRSGAITPVQARRVTSVYEAYDKAYKEHLQEKYDNQDAMLITAVFGKHIFQERMKEYMTSLDSQLAASAPRASELLDAAGVKGVAVPRVAGEPLVRWWTELFMDRLDNEQRAAVLRAARPELFADDDGSGEG